MLTSSLCINQRQSDQNCKSGNRANCGIAFSSLLLNLTNKQLSAPTPTKISAPP